MIAANIGHPFAVLNCQLPEMPSNFNILGFGKTFAIFPNEKQPIPEVNSEILCSLYTLSVFFRQRKTNSPLSLLCEI